MDGLGRFGCSRVISAKAQVKTLQAAGLTLGAVYALWVFFLAVMNLRRADKANTLGDFALYLGFPLILVAFLLDVVINLTLGTVLFLEWPAEWTLSERLHRNILFAVAWRQKMAVTIMRYLLEPFDTTGGHRAG